MALKHHNTHRSSRRSTQKKTSAKARKGALVRSFLDVDFFASNLLSSPLIDPSLEVLTRSQRLQLADLARRSGKPVETWVRRAVNNFLADELAVRMFPSERAA